jgi:hypothetical protein
MDNNLALGQGLAATLNWTSSPIEGETNSAQPQTAWSASGTLSRHARFYRVKQIQGYPSGESETFSIG